MTSGVVIGFMWIVSLASTVVGKQNAVDIRRRKNVVVTGIVP